MIVGAQTTERPGSVDVFGRARQTTLAETLIVSAALIKGNTTFKPPDYEFRVVPAFNVNRSQAEEVRALRVDPRVLVPRRDTEALVEVALRRAPAATRIADVGTGIGAPSLDGERKMGRVQQGRADDPHEPVIAGIEQLDPAIQARNAAGGFGGALERGTKLDEPQGRETLTLQ